VVDADRLRQSWSTVATHGDQVPLRFYSRLFAAAPETREMFPLSMAAQRDRLVTALGYTVSRVDDLDNLVPYLQQLGRDHRRFGALAQHYGPVGEVLLATLADFLGPDWTPELAQDWADAYGMVASTMMGAAEDAARYMPPHWSAEVVAHERRTFDIAVLTVQPDERYDYVPGQSMAVETAQRPRLWRYYSPANAPRQDGSIDLHVRRVPGGQVSAALVDSVQKGDMVNLGSPVGYRLTRPLEGELDLLLVAGGTGLAPLKALVEQVAAEGVIRDVELFVGARTVRELYDMPALAAMEAEHDWLSVTPVIRSDVGDAPGAERGTVDSVALRGDRWRGRDVYICGADETVQAALDRLRTGGCPDDRIHYEGFQGLGGDVYGVIEPRKQGERGGTQQ
jgi:NAD(P)H-flavin reductase/hemoglobin-like flavoprotein